MEVNMQENSNFTTTESESVSAPITQTRVRRYLPRLWWGLGIGGVIAVAFLVTAIASSGFSITPLVIALFLFTFGASVVLEDSACRDVMLWMCTKSISFPGLIWEFSIDGFIWLIGMKLLFWLIGVIFGIIVAIVGLILSILVAPFTYPFNLISYIRDSD